MDGPTRGPEGTARVPRVSVIMANYRGARHLGAAIASVLGQDMGDLELLVADDASDDDSAAIVRAAGARDPRVRLLAGPGPAPEGPSAARNRALAQARGAWVAIVDSDDLLHPRRLSILLEAAALGQADMVADDMLFFGDAPGTGGRTLLGALGLDRPLVVAPDLFVRSNDAGGELPSMGYLKPLVRRATLGALRYDPAIRVGEDYDLYLRLLLGGARFVVVPWPLYLYRRHAASLSHRLSVAALEPLLAAHEAVALGLAQGADPALGRALARRGRSLGRALRFERLVEALKGRKAGPAAALALRDPSLLALLARSLREGARRRLAQRGRPPEAARGAPEPARIVLMAEGDRAALAALGDSAGPGRDGVFAAPPLAADRPGHGPALHALACRLSAMAQHRPVEVTVAGAGGLDALGLLPAWRTATVRLAPGEAAPSLPPGAVLAPGSPQRAGSRSAP